MAIVKFISENDCQLFIDMEYVCNIYANKMHKVSLDADSYLVEAKGIHGNILNKYNLKVNPSDTQVLQSISDKKSSIDDSIQKLKNDSSLRFYNQRAVLKCKEQFGYINSQYKIIIPPEYSYAEDFLNKRTLVKKMFPNKEMATIIDTDGNICFGNWFEYVGGGVDKILLKDNRQFVVVSRDDFSITNKYCDAGYDGKSQLIPVYKEIGVDDMYGFIDKLGNEIVPLIYDNVWNFEESGYAKVKRFGHIHAVDSCGNLYRNIPYSNSKEDVITKDESIVKGFDYNDFYNPDVPIKEDSFWGIEEVEVNDEGEIIHSNRIGKYKCDKIICIDDAWISYRTDGVCVLAFNDEEKESIKFVADSIEPIVIGYCELSENVIIKRNNKYGVSDTKGNIIIPVEYGSVTPIIRHYHTYYAQEDTYENTGFIIQKNNKFGITNNYGEIVLPLEYDAIIPSDAMRKDYTGDYAIIRKNGKCSLVCVPTGKLLFPIVYDNIEITVPGDGQLGFDSTIIIKDKDKYGCVSFENRQILDSIYDDIAFEGYYNIVLNALVGFYSLKKDGKMGIYESYSVFVFSVEHIYDECVFLDNKTRISDEFSVLGKLGMRSVAVRQDNRWGILDIEPEDGYYFRQFSQYWKNTPNLNDLEFKYTSLDELKQDADAEFKRRYEKYYSPLRIREIIREEYGFLKR